MFHTIVIVGNVGRDPEMRYTPTGQAVTSFSVATNRQYTGSDGQPVKETIWFEFQPGENLPRPVSKYLKKGRTV